MAPETGPRLNDLATVISVAVVKGGAGKTSLTCNIAGILARAGWRILIVVIDPQDNVGEDLGYTHRGESDDGRALVDALLHNAPLRPSLLDVRPGLDVICCGEELSDAIPDMIRGDTPATALADALIPIAEDYDFILIDCPPGYSFLQNLALTASGWVLTPSQSDLSSRKGIAYLGKQFARARADNPDLRLLGVVLFDLTATGTRIMAEARNFIQVELGDLAPVLRTPIRTAKAAAKAARDRGLLMHELVEVPQAKWWEIRRGEKPASGIPASAEKVAADYLAVTDEILTILNTAKEQEQAR